LTREPGDLPVTVGPLSVREDAGDRGELPRVTTMCVVTLEDKTGVPL
jgi:hypothetical protein